MESMFDILMKLPLFSGISLQQISDFVAKTPLKFSSFSPGQSIMKKGERCDSVVALVSGEVRIEKQIYLSSINIKMNMSAPGMLNIHNLFGLTTEYDADYIADSQCGIMEFDKSLFLNLLSQNHICLLNILNMLSSKTHKIEDFISESGCSPGLNALLLPLSEMAVVNSSNFRIIAENPLQELFALKEEEIRFLKRKEEDGQLRISSDKCIEIPNRHALYDIMTSIR